MGFTDKEIVEGIFLNRNEILKYVYNKYGPVIKRFVLTNSGNTDDANDIFQDSIIIIYNKIKSNDLILRCTFKTYLYSVCRKIWLKQIKGRDSSVPDLTEVAKYVPVNDNIEETIKENEKYKLYQEHYKDISPECRKLLQLTIKKVSGEKIAEIMGYKNPDRVKRNRYDCLQNLKKRIKNDPGYLQLKKSG